MKTVLLGYMSSGKSSVGKLLAKQMQYDFIDLDHYISENEGMPISEIFNLKGELYFRKKEKEYLEKILRSSTTTNLVLSLGGGTPCYYNNMRLILEQTGINSVYLKVNIETLLQRLWKEKEHRPLIAHYKDKEGLEEFIRKHLFERQFYYLKAQHVIDVSKLSFNQIVENIQLKINN
ncbi:shikimate kinase [Psychroflexus salis]|uniref:Shikimate kinase n=1 Tax=Psychroflexus salis TaxID=1526574 RepID=A0A917E7M9_9FLAO|nr:shikimate kinase [Psychroflexus salis]GGE07159.1 shikimate kinase [Psychroflexus salis]